MSEPVTLTALELATLVGIPVVELKKRMQGRCKPNFRGDYPHDDGLKAAFAFLRDERDLITQDEMSVFLDCTSARVSQMVQEGLLEQNGRGRMERDKTTLAGFNWYRTRLSEGKSRAGEQKLEKGELELKILRTAAATAERSSIPRGDVDKAWENLILLTRQSFLGLANKLAPRMAFLKSEVEVAQVIHEAVEESLSNLSRPIDYDAEQVKDTE